jgi:hypothetical protein
MGFEVFLNLYDLASVNCLLHPMGIGAYHSAIQIKDSEFCYGAFEDEISGIMEIEPFSNKHVTFRKSISLGFTEYNTEEIAKIIEDMRPEYYSKDYDIFKRNCNTFSDEFSFKLLKKRCIPSYLTRLTRIFKVFRCCLSKKYISGGVLDVNQHPGDSIKVPDDESESTPSRKSDTKSHLIENPKKSPSRSGTGVDYKDFKRGKIVPIDMFESSPDIEKQNTIKSADNNHKIYNTEEVNNT